MRVLRLLFLVLPLCAQEPVFRSDTALALVRFHAIRKHTFVDDLKPEDVILLEDGQPRKIALFEGGGMAPRTLPMEMILLFDTSGSMRSAGVLDPVVYKTELLDNLPAVRLSIYSFTTSLRRLSEPTRDTAELARALQLVRDAGSKKGALQPPGTPLQLPPGRKGAPETWLFEAMIAAARDAAKGPAGTTRMLAVFSDGFSTTNTHPEDAAAALAELGIPAYPVILGHADIAAMKQSGQVGWPAMAELLMADFARTAELTGGRSFDPPVMDLAVVRQILAALAGQARSEYVAGFYPEPSPGGAVRHKVEIKLRSRDLGAIRGGVRTILH